ncbi:MAG: hypothetical protein ACJAU6_000471 [Alphaproteobacteria bacterium]
MQLIANVSRIGDGGGAKIDNDRPCFGDGQDRCANRCNVRASEE